jgi:hypothetical protein
MGFRVDTASLPRGHLEDHKHDQATALVGAKGTSPLLPVNPGKHQVSVLDIAIGHQAGASRNLAVPSPGEGGARAGPRALP